MHETLRVQKPSWRLVRVLGNRYTLMVLIVLFVFAARLLVVKRFGVNEPFMDSFSEVVDYKAAAENDYAKIWEHSLTLHNEHRIFLTHWTNVGLFVLNNEKWDLLLQACFNAVLAGFCAAALFAGVGRNFEGIHFLFFSGIVILAFGLPISYENMLWGFQSQHFYFVLFSVITISFLPVSTPFSLPWWAGLTAGILACLSIGSGFYALLSGALVCGLMALRRDYRSRRLAITAAACLLVLAAYFPALIGVHSDPQFKAHSVRQFVNALIRSLAWPNISWFQAWSALLVQLPSIALAFAVLFRRQPLPKSSYVILGLGIWNLLITLTLAYLRGAYIPYPRYYDYNCFNIIVNGAALLEISRLRLFPELSPSLRFSVATAWGVAILLGACQLTEAAWEWGLPQFKAELYLEQFAIRDFFHTGNAAVLKAPELHNIFPFTEQYSQYTGTVLRDPQVYRALPDDMKAEPRATRHREPLSRIGRALLRRSDYLIVSLGLLLATSVVCFLFSFLGPLDASSGRAIAKGFRP